jgi:hypothetical protein
MKKTPPSNAETQSRQPKPTQESSGTEIGGSGPTKPCFSQAAPRCVNLREQFGDRFRIGHDPAAQTWGERRDPWMLTIPCRRGVIYPHGDLLAVEIDGHRRLAKRVAAIPGVSVYLDGDDEKTFLFPMEAFDAVAAVVRPKRRPQLTGQQRAERAERMRRVRAQATRGVRRRGEDEGRAGARTSRE